MAAPIALAWRESDDATTGIAANPFTKPDRASATAVATTESPALTAAGPLTEDVAEVGSDETVLLSLRCDVRTVLHAAAHVQR